MRQINFHKQKCLYTNVSSAIFEGSILEKDKGLVLRIGNTTRGVNFLIPSFYPTISLPDVLCDPTDLIWRKGTPLEAMTGRTAPSDSLLAEVFWGSPRL